LTDTHNRVQSSNINVEEPINVEQTNTEELQSYVSSNVVTDATTVILQNSNVLIPVGSTQQNVKIDANHIIQELDAHKKKTNQPVIQIKRDYRGYKY